MAANWSGRHRGLWEMAVMLEDFLSDDENIHPKIDCSDGEVIIKMKTI